MKKEQGIKYISACRLCLSSARRTINILHTHLQPIFEKLINSKLHDEAALCFICHRRLQQCHELVTLIKETQTVREEYLKNGMLTQKPRPLVPLSICPVVNFGIPFEATDSVETVIKEEPDIKEEPEWDIEPEENGVEDSEGIEDESEEEEEEEPPSKESSESEDDVPLKSVKRKRGPAKVKNTRILNKKIKKENEE